MRTLTLHARIEITFVVALMLGSCGDNTYQRFTKGDYDRLDVADVNARNAIARVNALEARVEELERILR